MGFEVKGSGFRKWDMIVMWTRPHTRRSVSRSGKCWKGFGRRYTPNASYDLVWGREASGLRNYDLIVGFGVVWVSEYKVYFGGLQA